MNDNKIMVEALSIDVCIIMYRSPIYNNEYYCVIVPKQIFTGDSQSIFIFFCYIKL